MAVRDRLQGLLASRLSGDGGTASIRERADDLLAPSHGTLLLRTPYHSTLAN